MAVGGGRRVRARGHAKWIYSRRRRRRALTAGANAGAACPYCRETEFLRLTRS
jgi:hypothetical protein